MVRVYTEVKLRKKKQKSPHKGLWMFHLIKIKWVSDFDISCNLNITPKKEI